MTTHAPPTPTRTLVLLSGGLDSTVLAYTLREQGHELEALSVNYGQRHARELSAAVAIAAGLGIPHVTVDLSCLANLLPGCSLTDRTVAVPEGHYAAPTMRATVVPNRNMILAAIAVARAIATNCRHVAYAAHAGDHAIYPDCRPEFADALAAAVALCAEHPPTFIAPFVRLTKAQLVAAGYGMGVAFALTWSCYVGGWARHCGKCGTCVERREAFAIAGVPDPTPYDED